MKEKKLNINAFKTIIILIVAIPILSITGYFSYSNYQTNLLNMKNTEMQRLKSIVASLAMQIDADIHNELVKKYDAVDAITSNQQDLDYLEINNLLQNAQIANNLAGDIYTMVINTEESENSFFVVTSADKPYFKHAIDVPEETVINYEKIHVLAPYEDDHGLWVSAFAPLQDSNYKTVGIVQADIQLDSFIQNTQDKAIKSLIKSSIIVSTILALIMYVLNFMLNRIQTQQNYILKEFVQLDELSSYISKFLENIVKGNFEDIDDSFSGNENKIYQSLIETKKKIVETNKNEREQQWLLKGKSEINTILQKNDSIENLGYEIIKSVVAYSGAVQGALYMMDDKTKIISMKSRYAYNRKKYQLSDYKIGEGLIGQCAFEKDTIYRTEIPEEYASITSGLITDKKPSSILLVPLLNGKDILGIIEIASIRKFSDIEIKFVEQVGLITSQTIFNILTNEQTNEFLKNALKMGEELQEQKVVLEQNAEEMKSTQEELERTNNKLEEQFKEVENQQKKLHSLLSKSSEIITIYDDKFNVTYKSPSVEHILGFKPDEFINDSSLDEMMKKSNIVLRKMFDYLIANPKKHHIIEFESYKKDGSKVWLEADGRNLLKDSAIKGIVVNSRDITERREAEKEQEMRAKMQALSENSQDIIIRFDLKGNFLYVNSRLSHYTGVSLDFYRKNFNDIEINKDIIKRWNRILQDIQKKPKLIQREMPFYTEVDDFIMQLNAIPEFNKNDELDSVLIVLHDITSRKKQEILIQDTNKKITESINYAKRIQNAIIPIEEELKMQFNDFLMFYMPKDVVSGDFPWYYKNEDYIYMAAVDCTGHGVPGAMMSLIGCLLLNDIVNGEENLTPSEILLKLHKGVVRTLKQDVKGNNTSDGMDVALCRISLKTNELQFSGAHRPFYLLRDNKIEQLKGSPFPIGGTQYRGKNKYKNYELEYTKGDKVYFFSDGLPDQFNSKGNDKYSPQRIRETVIQHQDKSMKELENIFRQDLIEWMGEEKQLDDVLLMGISF